MSIIISRKKKQDGVWAIINGFSGIPFLVFFVFVCYALSASNTTEVHEACGEQLWKMIFAHLLVPIGLSLVIILITVSVTICAFGFSEMGESNLPIISGVISGLVMLMYCSLFLGLGYPIVRDAMYSEKCVKALSHASFTNTPLLGILGCVYLVFDVILLSLLVLSLVLLIGFCVLYGSSNKPKPEDQNNKQQDETTSFFKEEIEDFLL